MSATRRSSDMTQIAIGAGVKATDFEQEMRSLKEHVLQKEAENSILQDKLKELQAHATDLADRLANQQTRKKSAGSKPRK